jgi:HD-like signal output (HDOD) protein/CheY-like chemotaxis protein
MVEERTRVLFVDDEDNVLNGLRRMLYGMRKLWDMTFCNDPRQALGLMAAASFDAVVSDMRMPGMDGADFLGEVQRRWPDTVRLILSGYTDDHSIFRTIGPAHAYLAKPCDQRTLVEAVARPVALRNLLAAASLRQPIAGLSNLPSVPELFLELEQELQSPRASAASVAAIVSRDVAMTAEILKLTNSSYFSSNAKVSSVLQAVRTLGFETIQTLVLRLGIFRLFRGNGDAAPMMRALNSYSLTIGMLAGALATEEHCPVPTVKIAHCAGMLSCIGCLPMIEFWPDRYGRALVRVGPTLALDAAETAIVGASHALVGAYLLGIWAFSPPVVEAVAYARDPSSCLDRQFSPLTAVHVALALGPRFPLLPPEAAPPDLLDLDYLEQSRLLHRLPHWRRVAEACLQRSEATH